MNAFKQFMKLFPVTLLLCQNSALIRSFSNIFMSLGPIFKATCLKIRLISTVVIRVCFYVCKYTLLQQRIAIFLQ